MKILILSSYREVCGIARYAADLVDALTQAAHTVEVFPINGPALDRRARDDLLSHFDGFFARVADHDAVVIQHEYALYAGMHGYEAACDVFARLLTRLQGMGKPILIMFHTDPPGTARVPPLAPVGRFRRDAWRRMAATINRMPNIAVTVHSTNARQRMIGSGIAPEKISVVALPIMAAPPAEKASPRSGEVRLAIFGFVGRYKGYELALRSLFLLPAHYRLTIVGGPHPRDPNNDTIPSIRAFLESGEYPRGDLPPLAATEASTVRFKLAGRVTITGIVPDDAIATALHETDIVLLPYTSYGPIQSAAAAWALACRRPIVATAVETFADIVAERPCMHLVAPDSPEALAEGIRRVAENPAVRGALTHEAALYAADHSWQRAAAFIVDRLAGSPPRAWWRRAGSLLRPAAPVSGS